MLRRTVALARAHAPRRAAFAAAPLSPLRRYNSLASTPPPPAPTQPPQDVSPQALLRYYTQSPTRTLTYQELTMYGPPPLDEPTLLHSAERTRKELLAGLARRVSQHLSLPFLPATNPSLAKVHQLYSSAFFNLSSIPEVKTLADNERLCKVMAQMVEEHRDNIPLLAKGFKESRKYLPDATITDFLDRAIRNRISLRLMAEQHLSLSAASLPYLHPAEALPSPPASEPKDLRVEPSARPPSSSLSASRVGILDLALKPYDLITNCAEYVKLLCEGAYGVAPNYRIEGGSPDMTVGAIGSHLEYTLTELLKNAFRATIEHNVPKPEEKDPDEFRFEDLPHAHMLSTDFPEVLVTVSTVPGAMTIRIRDRGGGIPPENVHNVFSYAFTSVPALPDPDFDPDSPAATYGGTANAGYYGGVGGGPQGGESALQTNVGTLAGLGFGLPLSRIYAGYFGGSLDLVSMYGWGTDVYCVMKTV
ncbi:pyruvate dehydrogenase kinase [Rhodotorula diobovata]|uniref:Protein-serine/threonine kinase n=1 Tax=Rhodotorula diobovata TaxID=5288 RepID=A0A5C5FTI5_9BASI|nr:pyruvate dehydrogenase kinase [Rhodotorula diobovata]